MSEDFVKGAVLYSDNDHQFIWLGWEEDTDIGMVQVNQYLIIHQGRGILIDPGGIHVFSKVIANTSRYINLDCIDHIFYSHQDPDVSSGIALWLSVCNAKIHISKWWVRFIPHYGVIDENAMIPVEDSGVRIPLSGSDYLQIIPAHFLHSPGNFHLYDSRSKILFSGDMGLAVFPSDVRYLYVENFPEHVNYMEGFHQRFMASNKVLQYYVNQLSGLQIDMIAPQHGSVFKGKHVSSFLGWLKNLKCGSDLLDNFYR